MSFQIIAATEANDDDSKLALTQGPIQNNWNVFQSASASDNGILLYKNCESASEAVEGLARLDPDPVVPYEFYVAKPRLWSPITPNADLTTTVSQLTRDRIIMPFSTASGVDVRNLLPSPEISQEVEVEIERVRRELDLEAGGEQAAPLVATQSSADSLEGRQTRADMEPRKRAPRRPSRIQKSKVSLDELDDFALLRMLPRADRHVVAESILRKRNGLIVTERRDLVDVNIEKIRALRKGIDQWRALARITPVILIFTLLISAGLLWLGYDLTRADRINGYEFSIVIFLAALFAISPATLLLLERPLAGLDKATAPYSKENLIKNESDQGESAGAGGADSTESTSEPQKDAK